MKKPTFSLLPAFYVIQFVRFCVSALNLIKKQQLTSFTKRVIINRTTDVTCERSVCSIQQQLQQQLCQKQHWDSARCGAPWHRHTICCQPVQSQHVAINVDIVTVRLSQKISAFGHWVLIWRSKKRNTVSVGLNAFSACSTIENNVWNSKASEASSAFGP